MEQIRLECVSREFSVGGQKTAAVHDVTLALNKGEFVSIVGHSGSGKTTLLSVMGGILRPTFGKVLFDGSDVYAKDEDGLAEYRATRIGFMFQFSSLMPVLTSKENLLLPTLFTASGRPASALEQKALELLSLVGLSDKADSFPAHLSGGQQRRVAIARALMNDPDVVLADEPTGDLDEETESDVIGFFRKINRERGITFVLVTHSSELAREAGRRLRMSQGKLEELPS